MRTGGDAFDMAVKRYRFQDRSGYIVSPETAGQTWLTIGHSFRPPAWSWSDPWPHRHTASEELYVLVQGQMRLLVAEAQLTLSSKEILMVRPGVLHAVADVTGPLEHVGVRAPVLADKERGGEMPSIVPATAEPERDIEREWGCRVSLQNPRHHNRWLLGAGSARFATRHLALAYLNFPTREEANAGLGTRHRRHYHQRSWEYYVVLRGQKTLLIEDEPVVVEPGEILEVPPGVRHTLYGREAPFEGFTLRAPVELYDKVEG